MESLTQSRISHRWMEPLVPPFALCQHKSLQSWAENTLEDMTPAKAKRKFLKSSSEPRKVSNPIPVVAAHALAQRRPREQLQGAALAGLKYLPKCGEKQLHTNGQSNMLWLNTPVIWKTIRKTIRTMTITEEHGFLLSINMMLSIKLHTPMEIFQCVFIYTRTYKQTPNSSSSQLLLQNRRRRCACLRNIKVVHFIREMKSFWR